MNKKTVGSMIIVTMLLAVSLYFVGGTYARYVSKFTGEGQVTVAKWAVQLDEGSGSGEEMTLDLKAKETEDVVKTKIAPASSAEGTAEIELNGTEVAVEVQAEVDKDVITTALQSAGITGVTNHDITVSTKVENADGSNLTIEGDGSEEPYVVKLPEGQATGFTATDKLKVTITVTWDNGNDLHNEDHTKIGTEATQAIKIPVTLHVYQHINAQDYTIPEA